MDDVGPEFRGELKVFFSDTLSQSAPPLLTSQGEIEALKQTIDLKESYMASHRKSLIANSAARKSDSEAKKNESDSKLYPLFIGIG